MYGLIVGGFLSYASTAVVIAFSPLVISIRSGAKLMLGAVLASYLGLSIFVSYYAGRDTIRESVWGGASYIDRIQTVGTVFSEFVWFDPSSETQFNALDSRLNQNYFVGVAAKRLNDGEVNYLYGRSLWEGILALVPRAIWPDKPVYGGSPKIVTEMTGLQLDTENTSWGVGNIMEFYINFGVPGLIAGCSLLGWALRKLDRKAAEAEANDNLGHLILYFLPAIALIQPLGSLVELSGGVAAALVAANGWKRLWEVFMKRAGIQVL